ncbi:MAG: hypothetical protein O3B22_02655 [Proteobacteria bacterium]|nr:hypothetical protein [Pseudomonadota bacterium]MDA1070967.1 hypothetical protein [Pseudomonadota bacterium]
MLGIMNSQVNTFHSMPPAVVVCTLEQACAVVAAARRLRAEVILLTEPGAHAWHGPGYLLEMMVQAGAPRAILDCGRDAGTAMLALRLGWRELHLGMERDGTARIVSMTCACGGRFHAVLPPALALHPGRPVDEPLAQWLAAHGSN